MVYCYAFNVIFWYFSCEPLLIYFLDVSIRRQRILLHYYHAQIFLLRLMAQQFMPSYQ